MCEIPPIYTQTNRIYTQTNRIYTHKLYIRAQVDRDRIWAGGDLTPVSDKFDIGEMIVLRGFSHAGNNGVFEVAGYVDNNTMVISETLPEVSQDTQTSTLLILNTCPIFH